MRCQSKCIHDNNNNIQYLSLMHCNVNLNVIFHAVGNIYCYFIAILNHYNICFVITLKSLIKSKRIESNGSNQVNLTHLVESNESNPNESANLSEPQVFESKRTESTEPHCITSSSELFWWWCIWCFIWSTIWMRICEI